MILSIDTTTKKASVALKFNNEIICKDIDNEITHSEKLLPLISSTLEEYNKKLSDVELFACTLGPGSFTGIRIGISTVKAMAKVMDKKIFGITSLKLLALGARSTNHKYILSTLDAKHNRVYFELFKNEDDKLIPENIYGNLQVKDLVSLLLDKGIQDMLVLSDNIDILKDNFSSNFTNISFENGELDLKNIFKADFSDSSHIYNYLNLDAKYYRASEVERTKLGE